jgi:DNA-binding MarR family transcriptional regulator
VSEAPREPEFRQALEREPGAPVDDAAGEVPYLFGDLLALARADWMRQMRARLAERGHAGYRASDTVIVRLLRRRRSATIGEIGMRLGITRQAARKLVNGLGERGIVAEARDEHDARKVNVTLTKAGHAYARAVIATVYELNHDVAGRLDAAQLAGADAALRAAIIDPRIRALADHVPPPARPG